MQDVKLVIPFLSFFVPRFKKRITAELGARSNHQVLVLHVIHGFREQISNEFFLLTFDLILLARDVTVGLTAASKLQSSV